MQAYDGSRRREWARDALAENVSEAEPGRTLGKYTIRRIIKADGTLALRKFKTP